MNIEKEARASRRFIEQIAGKLTLGRLLWAIRKGEEESQVVFAEKLGISRQQLCDIEHDRKAVAPKTATNYAKILGYSPEQFIRLSLQDGLERAGLHMTVEVKPKKPRSTFKAKFA